MNNDSHFTTIGDEPVEARIVAWVLGEASAFEAAELERLCEEKPELMVFKRRMAALHGLLAEAEKPQADEGWKLPENKRKALDDIFGEEKPIRLEIVREKRIGRSGRRVLLAIAACVLLTLFIARLQPWKQTSEAIIEVKPRTAGMSPLGADMAESSSAGRMTPQFFGTESEKIKSRSSLEKVVDKLDLTDRWGMDKEQAVAKLKKSIKTENVDGTDMLKIQVRQSNKQDADEITREVAYAYKDYREQLDKRDSEKALMELNKAVRDQEDKVEERRKVLASIVRNKGVFYKGDDEAIVMNDDSRDAAIKRGLDAQDYVDAKRKFETDEQLLQTMKLKQMGETILRKIPSESVVLHEVPEVGAKSSRGERAALAANAPARTQPLRTNLPAELIEGTPKPMNVPNLESPKNGPAGSGSWGSESPDAGESFGELSVLSSLGVSKPSSPPVPSAQRSSQRVMAEGSSSNFSIPESALAFEEMKGASDDLRTEEGGTVSRELAQRDARPRVVAPAPTAPSQPAAAAMKRDSGVDPFSEADENATVSRLPAKKALEKSGAGTIESQNIDGMLSDSGRVGEEEAAGKLKQAEVASEPAAVPVLGDHYANDDKSGFSENSSLAQNDELGLTETRSGSGTYNLSGFNTYSGGTIVNGGALGVGGSSGLAGSAPAASATPMPDQSVPAERGGFAEGDATRAGLLAGLDSRWEDSAPADKDARDRNGRNDLGRLSHGDAAPIGGGVGGGGGRVSGKSQAGKSSYPGESKSTTSSEIADADADFSSKTTASPESLAKAIRDQEEKVEERRKVLATIVRNKGIISKAQDSSSNQAGVDEHQGARDVLQTYLQVEQEKMQLESQISSLLKYDNDQLMVYAGGLNLPDNIIRTLYPQYQEAKRQLDGLKIGGLNDKHPTVRTAVDQIEKMKRQLNEGVVDLRATLQAQLDLANHRLKRLEAMENDASKEAIKRGFDAQDYVDAKREFEMEMALLNAMKMGATKNKPAPPKVDLTKLMEEIPAAQEPYSTFSLNISDASFQIAKAALAKGERPDPAGIKVEQFYNAVDYGDPAPGANEPVAVNIEQSAHPVIPGRNLVRIALKTAAAGRAASQPLRLTLLVDQSGSMVREDRRAAMDKALAGLSGLLTGNDLVTVIGFSRTPRLLADGMAGDKAAKLKDLINQSASEGGTNLEEAMKLGEQLAVRRKLTGAQNRIVLFTDGAANLGNADPERLAEKVKQLRQKGIAFDIAGIAADGLNDELLGELARNGNGRYYVVGKGGDDNFAKQLAGAFRPAAENVKVQVRFNPERVGRYKLIGFEKDRLKTEDFRNDKVDAAELAAEEAGVAIYQVEPLADGHGELGEVSVRFRDTAMNEMVERTWTISHDSGAPAIDRATPSMQLATLAMLAGEKLKGGPLAEAIDFKQLAASTANVKQLYGNTGRVGDMLHVVDALK